MHFNTFNEATDTRGHINTHPQKRPHTNSHINTQKHAYDVQQDHISSWSHWTGAHFF